MIKMNGWSYGDFKYLDYEEKYRDIAKLPWFGFIDKVDKKRFGPKRSS